MRNGVRPGFSDSKTLHAGRHGGLILGLGDGMGGARGGAPPRSKERAMREITLTQTHDNNLIPERYRLAVLGYNPTLLPRARQLDIPAQTSARQLQPAASQLAMAFPMVRLTPAPGQENLVVRSQMIK